MASTYVPADVYNRFQTIFGRDSVLVGGIDVHSIFVSTDGRTRAGADALCDRWEASYRRAFAAMGIAFDVLERTDHPAHRRTIDETLLRLRASGDLTVKPVVVSVCAGCGAVPPPRLLLPGGHSATARCPYCGGSDIEQESREHLHLRLEPNRGRLESSLGLHVQSDARAALQRILAVPLADWCISRDNAIGLTIPFGPARWSLYLWVESLVGYATFAGLTALGGRDDLRFVHFFGKNIQYYHAVAWPVLLERGLGRDPDRFSCSARGFLDVARSDPALVDVERATSRYHRDYLRFFLGWRVPDGQADYALTVAELEDVVGGILVNRIGNVIRRLALILARNAGRGRTLATDDPLIVRFHEETVPHLTRCIDDFRLSAAVRAIASFAKLVSAEMERRRIYVDPDSDALGFTAYMLAALLVLLRPIVPELVEVYAVFAGWRPVDIATVAEAVHCPVTSAGGSWTHP